MRTGNPTEWGYLAKVLSRSDSLVEPCTTGEFVRAQCSNWYEIFDMGFPEENPDPSTNPRGFF